MKPTKFRVWMIPHPPGEPATVPVETVREACLVLNTMVAIRQNLEDRELPVWYDDVSGVEVFNGDSQEWEDFYDENGEDFDHYYDQLCEACDSQILRQKLVDIVGEY